MLTTFDTAVTEGGATIVRATGHLDMVAAPQFKALVASIVMGEPTAIVVDLGGVEFVDSSGLGAIISGLRTSREAGKDFRIASATAQVLAVLDLTRLNRILPPYDSVEAALEGG